MNFRNSRIQPRMESQLHKLNDIVKNMKNQSNLSSEIVENFEDFYRQSQRDLGQKSKVRLWRKISSNILNTEATPHKLYNDFLNPTIVSLNSDGYADPLSAFENRADWVILLLNEFSNNQNVQYIKIIFSKNLKSNQLSLELIKIYKEYLATALNNAGIQKALCSFDIKASYASCDGGYFHNMVAHIFYDKNRKENITEGSAYNKLSAVINSNTFISRSIYNDITAYAHSLMPLCFRSGNYYKKPLKIKQSPVKVTFPRLHIANALHDMGFVDRLLLHGYTLEKALDERYLLV